MDGIWTPNRIAPRMAVQCYQTYMISSPVATHTRSATCSEVECAAQAQGWTTRIDVSTELGQRQANYIRLKSGRSFTFTQAGTIISFVFAAGQRCFADHRKPLDRPSLFIKRGGDWRQQTSVAVRMRDIDWVDDFATHQDDLATRIRRG